MSGFYNPVTGQYQALPVSAAAATAHLDKLREQERRRQQEAAERQLVMNLSGRWRMMLGTCLPPEVL
ncbi:hypothetical protein DEM26_08980 [Thioclava sp. NG1]|uniref:hypothetical protein n=1 Tax=Thioclava sp. NG1 TaxID=2182426 RepID=UPI000D609872|nr:hypothetical protein [Thioclava sp. NG1]PWE50074.1 hypothetical protein DEM26_08980 [Thioclava sp. NG1]